MSTISMPKGESVCLCALGELLSPEKDASVKFVLTTGLEKCLVLYPEDVWAEFESKLAALSIRSRSGSDSPHLYGRRY